MDPSKKELQGPRPAPLKVRKDSHKIRKPPVPPPQQPAPPPPQQPPTHHRPPVIIYTVSPKVIHTNPSEFMTLVQRLTGSSNTTAQWPSSSSNNIPDNNHNEDISMNNSTTFSSSPHSCSGGGLSGAARFAAMEKGRSPESMWKSASEMDNVVETSGTRTGLFPGILSPGPRSLQPIPASFFSPGSDPGSLSGYFPDLSPAMLGGFVIPSPSTFYPSQIMASPNTPSVDLFSHFGDH